jgi:probable F420-dependent oxidoreductase
MDRDPSRAVLPPVGVTAAPFIKNRPEVTLDLGRLADRLGYHSLWVAEVSGFEAFSVLGAASQATRGLGLGTGVVPVQVRTPPLLAMAATSLQHLAPDREVLLGIGVSSPVVAADWHGADYGSRPLAHVREFVALLRECLSGEPVTFQGDFYELRRFRLGMEIPDRQPQIVIGALSQGMLRLAGEVADGVLLNYLPASLVPWSVGQVRLGGDARIYANVHVGVGDRAVADRPARYDLFSYAVVDSYARNFSRAGFAEEVQAIRAAHNIGDRSAALAAVTDAMIDAIDVVGSGALVHQTVQQYREAGVDVPVIFPLTWGSEGMSALEPTLAAAVGQ